MSHMKDLSFKRNPLIPKSGLRLKKSDDNSIITEPVFSLPSKKRVKSSGLGPENQVHLSELHSLFKNPKQFMWLFGVELEYHLPPKSYVTWPYMIAIVKGDKKLVKSSEIRLNTQLPRFEQLSMKKVWPQFSNRADINLYMPILGENANPPRRYFYEVLHSVFNEEFTELITNAKNERTLKQKKANKIITADPLLLTEIRSLKIWTNIASSKMTKRVLVNPSKRKSRNALNQIFED